MRAIVNLDDDGMISATTSKGAWWAQLLRSNGSGIMKVMETWVIEQLAAPRRVIWEINYEVAKSLLILEGLADHEGFPGLPSDLFEQLVATFPELRDNQYRKLLDGQRNENEGAGQSGSAACAARPEEAKPGDCDRPDSVKERIRLVHNFQTGEEVVAEWNGSAYVVKVPSWVNRNALKGLILASKPGGFTDAGDTFYFTLSS